jgi:hypothetical protein
MAISKIGAIKSTLSVAIDYITNPQKTENGLYVISYGCSADSKLAEQQFLEIRNYGTGMGDVLAQHIKQSFKGKEVTPEEALQCGIELANKLLKGNYQYIIATHTDKDNIHNHIIFNNISFDDYRSFEYKENRGGISWKNLRKYNDEICNEHNLSVIENPQEKTGKCYYEWQQDFLGKSWKSKLRCAIDETIMESSSFDDFLNNIQKRNIECKYTPENVIKIKFRMKGQERFSRGKTLGWYYDEPQIRRRIKQYQLLKTGISGRNIKTKIIDTQQETFQTAKGLLRWAEVQNMKEASKVINFLTTHNLTSEEDINKKSTEKYNNRMIIVSKLNQSQNKVDEISDVIKLLRTYKKYKPSHDEYLKARNKNKYKKDHTIALDKYDDVVQKLKVLYPNKKLPNVDKLEKEKADLIKEIKSMNDDYKSIVAELKELETARKTISDYMKTIDKSASKSQLE